MKKLLLTLTLCALAFAGTSNAASTCKASALSGERYGQVTIPGDFGTHVGPQYSVFMLSFTTDGTGIFQTVKVEPHIDGVSYPTSVLTNIPYAVNSQCVATFNLSTTIPGGKKVQPVTFKAQLNLRSGNAKTGLVANAPGLVNIPELGKTLPFAIGPIATGCSAEESFVGRYVGRLNVQLQDGNTFTYAVVPMTFITDGTGLMTVRAEPSKDGKVYKATVVENVPYAVDSQCRVKSAVTVEFTLKERGPKCDPVYVTFNVLLNARRVLKTGAIYNAAGVVDVIDHLWGNATMPFSVVPMAAPATSVE